MSGPLLALVGFIYLGVALDLFLKGNPGMCLAFVSYAVANVGFIIAIRQGMAGG